MAPSATGIGHGGEARENSPLEPIAICGMACRLPGQVDSESSFWQMLVDKRTGQTPKVPESRFNVDAHYHEKLDRPGSFNVPGGYFLDGRPEDFDPTFFNITPVEAQWLDPQQRKTLEVCYEALVSAGITLERIAGSNTAVFVGSFTADYQQMSTRDTDFRHNYAATGVDPGIISNRIGHMFNLRGPSFTINTACSSSVYAIHNACHALRMRDCDAAITAGVNLILTVDQHMNTAKLGILSPTSTCHTFDASADGYGRAEGAGALFLKRLSDAIRDGDPIRGVIRSSAVNTNGRIDGTGITHPSKEGQERVIRMAYKRAKLDPRLTVYAELHGTGTPVGDPIEVEAVSRAMNDTRPKSKPLLIGALKPNIGHSEAASGIFAVMKAALMTEAALIPGVALLQRLNPEIKEDDWNVRVNANTVPWPEDSAVRRASVSSFGYGGTNGHVIIESVDTLYPWYQHGQPKRLAAYDHRCAVPLLLCLSAHDNATLWKNVEAVSAVANDYYVADLAHTLNLHRTMFSSRAFAIAREDRISDAFARDALRLGTVPKRPATNVGFLFTGQGAQWTGMFKHALMDYPLVMDIITRLDLVLQRLDPQPTFRIAEMLMSGGDGDGASRINDPDVAQPLCTAIQIAIVDLLARWGIAPTVSVGHSSGEIGAAYAAGLISAPEAIVAAFCRGRAVREASCQGSMLAVGLGAGQVGEFLPRDPSRVCIACENSPSSVTLSGQAEDISRLGTDLAARGIFAREVKTGRAYHSPHMEPVGAVYDDILAAGLGALAADDLKWRRPRSDMVSSVSGSLVTSETLPQGYWSANLRQRVRFNDAVRVVCEDERFKPVTLMLEIGPHAALSGPFKQICLANQVDRLTYVPSLVRNKNDTEQLLSLAGALFLAGYPVSLQDVNAEGYRNTHGSAVTKSLVRKPRTQYLLVDLPPYQWNYAKRYWAEPRASAEQRAPTHARHDLLGRRVPGLAERTKVWRNVLRHRDIPWLKDHSLGGTAIFPAAGYLSMATEALWQVRESAGLPMSAVQLRDVDIMKALALPDGDGGVEIVVSLTDPEAASSSSGGEWHEFSVESLADGAWTLHCTGRVSARHKPLAPGDWPGSETSLTQRVRKETWYGAFHRVGFSYTDTFQQIQGVRTRRGLHLASGEVTIRDRSGVMQGESRSMIHPSTVDACLQLIIISIHAGRHKEMPWGVVPLRIQEVSLALPDADDVDRDGRANAWTDSFESRHFNTHARLFAPSGKPLVDIKNLTCISYEAAIPAAAAAELSARTPAPFSLTSWKPDILSLTGEQAARLWPEPLGKEELVTKVTELIAHRQPVGQLLMALGSQLTPKSVRKLLDVLPASTSITIGISEAGEDAAMDDLPGDRVRRVALADMVDPADQTHLGLFDIVLAGFKPSEQSSEHSFSLETATALTNVGGWILGLSDGAAHDPIPSGSIRIGHNFVFQKQDESPKVKAANGVNGHNGIKKEKNGVNGHNGVEKETNGVSIKVNGHRDPKRLALLRAPSNATSIDEAGQLEGWGAHIASLGHDVRCKRVAEFDADQDSRVVIDDSEGTLLLSPDQATFAAIQRIFASPTPTLWLTRGVREGKNAAGGMADGFLRVIRSEQVATRVALLDVGTEETAEDVGSAVAATLGAVATSGPGRDTEFWLHRGALHIPRIYPDRELNGQWNARSAPAASALEKQALPRQVPLVARAVGWDVVFAPEKDGETHKGGGATLQTLVFGPRPSPESPPLVVGSIIDAADSPCASPSLVGKVAVAVAPDDRLRTTLHTSQYAVVDDSLVVTTPLEHLGQSLSLVGRLTEFTDGYHKLDRGTSVFLLPGPGPIFNALRLLAKSQGWHITVVAGPDHDQITHDAGEKRLLSNDTDAITHEVLLHQSRTRRVAVIAFEFSALGQEVWRCLRGRSRFFLMRGGRADHAMMTPEALPFAHGASFIPVTQPLMDAARLRQSLEVLSRLLENGWHGKEDDANVVDAANLPVSAIAHPRQDPSLVVSCSYATSQVKILNSTTTRFSPSATYLLVGCLGGLGRSLTQWMMEQGARHFAFFSRSGTDKPEAALVVEQIRQQGGHSRVSRVDASDEEAVGQAVLELQAERPIRGVVHAAMVLQDTMFERMSHQGYMAAVRPKAHGALNLHNALKGVDLDFFVMTSSISAVLGNPGQSNYSAANSFLDALALKRRAAGQVATSLALPMVLDVGVVAESDNLEASLRRKGLYGIDEEEMLRGLDFATRSGDDAPESAVLLMGLDAGELANAAQSETYWSDDARLCHVRAALDGAAATRSQKQGSGGDEDLAAAVETAISTGGGWQAAIGVVAGHIARRVASILMLRVEDIELEGRSIASYGLDSMIGAEMRTWLFQEFGLDYPFQKLLAPTLTFTDLAVVAAESLGYKMPS
ncbi:ketoacyl-synt-domain-containing protein [Colletotrichum somersetense]|nr:ketoacyl-synt-domain-containing protein [Colletotrichum somersetense]